MTVDAEQTATAAAESAESADTATLALRYFAFVSYSHHDHAIAARLQRALESYRIPRDLIGTQTPLGRVPRRPAPVFRDRLDLAASTDLRASIIEALGASRWLIVLCSPDAARSIWVEREIEEFVRQRDARHVLAIIVRGEPNASLQPGGESQECLPRAFRARSAPAGASGSSAGKTSSTAAAEIAETALPEPAALDLRPGQDAWRTALSRLVAGMTGLAADDLLRRQAQRRLRLWMAAAATSLVLTIAFASIAIVALRLRDEARERRASAEQLVEFMLGDLHGRLQPLGRLDLLDAVGRRALAHYSGRAATTLDADEANRQARALHLLGQIAEQRGQLQAAGAAFARAAAATERLLAAQPSDAERVYSHAQSMFWVGYAAWLQRRMGESERAFAEYLRLARRLTASDPQRTEWRLEVAYATQNLGNVLLGSARPVEAHRLFVEARSTIESLRGSAGFNVTELANTHGWIAVAERQLGRYRTALAAQQHKIALLQLRPGSTVDRVRDEVIANGLLEIGMIESKRGRSLQAATAATAAIAAFDELVAADPSNSSWRAHHAEALLLRAELAMQRGDCATAHELLDATRPQMEAMSRSRERRPGRRITLVGAWWTIAQHCPHPRFDSAKPLRRAFLQGTASELASGAGIDLDQRKTIAALRLAVGDEFAARAADTQTRRNTTADAHATALAHWRHARELLPTALARVDPEALAILSRLELRLEQRALANTRLKQLRGSSYRGAHRARLQRELASWRRF